MPSLHVSLERNGVQQWRGGENVSLQAVVRLNKLSALTPAVLGAPPQHTYCRGVRCVTELSQVSSPPGTNPPTVATSVRCTGGEGGREIKKGKGNEVGLYWSDGSSRWGTAA